MLPTHTGRGLTSKAANVFISEYVIPIMQLRQISAVRFTAVFPFLLAETDFSTHRVHELRMLLLTQSYGSVGL